MNVLEKIDKHLNEASKSPLNMVDEMISILQKLKKNIMTVKFDPHDVDAEIILGGSVKQTWLTVQALEKRTRRLFE